MLIFCFVFFLFSSSVLIKLKKKKLGGEYGQIGCRNRMNNEGGTRLSAVHAEDLMKEQNSNVN